jgi:hypothetical protein
MRTSASKTCSLDSRPEKAPDRSLAGSNGNGPKLRPDPRIVWRTRMASQVTPLRTKDLHSRNGHGSHYDLPALFRSCPDLISCWSSNPRSFRH